MARTLHVCVFIVSFNAENLFLMESELRGLDHI